MPVAFWILMGISGGLSWLTSLYLLTITHAMLPPMIEAVPNLQWTGLAAILVNLSELCTQHPPVIFAWPVLVLGCGVLAYKNKKLHPASVKIAVVVTILSIGFFLALHSLTFIGSLSMQDQLTISMGV